MTKYELAKKFRDNDYNCDEIHCSECQTIEPKFCNCTLIDLKTWADEILNNPLEVTDTVKEPTKHLQVPHYETKYFSDVSEMNSFLKTIPCDKFKDIKIQNKDYLVIYQVHGEV